MKSVVVNIDISKVLLIKFIKTGQVMDNGTGGE